MEVQRFIPHSLLIFFVAFCCSSLSLFPFCHQCTVFFLQRFSSRSQIKPVMFGAIKESSVKRPTHKHVHEPSRLLNEYSVSECITHCDFRSFSSHARVSFYLPFGGLMAICLCVCVCFFIFCFQSENRCVLSFQCPMRQFKQAGAQKSVRAAR